jgi:hypothetical protein
MSTKLNDQELAAKRWPDNTIQRNTWRGMHKRKVNRMRERNAYTAAIREVAQPIADDRDELLDLVSYIVHNRVSCFIPSASGEWDERAIAILAKYKKP